MYKYVTIRKEPKLIEKAAEWFSKHWHIPKEAYLKEMKLCLENKTEYDWYLCLSKEDIIGGLGVIQNDFNNRKDLFPNVCAVYTEETYRGQGIAGNLLNMVVTDMKSKGITPIYLLADIVGFYEKYGWEFLCMAQGDGEDHESRVYIHR